MKQEFDKVYKLVYTNMLGFSDIKATRIPSEHSNNERFTHFVKTLVLFAIALHVSLNTQLRTIIKIN